MQHRFVWSTLMSTVITTVFITLLTIAGELYTVTREGVLVHPIKDFLKVLHGHHWVGKGVWAICVFVLVSLILTTAVRDQHYTIDRALRIAAYTLVLMTLILYGFFTYEFMMHH